MLIFLDAGHGGSDPGAVNGERKEKDDNLALALAVGEILEKNGLQVGYTRQEDIYETPFKKATDANEAGADYFVSFHRNSSETPNVASGVQTLIFSEGGEKERLADNIQKNLVELGFKDLGIVERPNLVVLKRTAMPAVLIETGFINNETDNAKFDEDFDRIAQAVADAILETIGRKAAASAMEDEPVEAKKICTCDKLYRVQIGAFENRDNADRMLSIVVEDGFPGFIIYDGGLYKVQVGAFRELDNAVRMERRLRRYRYNTFITE